MPPARSTQSHVGLALAPATDYRYCVHLFHVNLLLAAALFDSCADGRGPYDEKEARFQIQPGSA